MARNADKKVDSQHFAGSSKVFTTENGGLSAMARSIISHIAFGIVQRLNILDMVDSSGGTAGIVATFDATGGTIEDQVTVVEHGLATGDGPFQFSNSGGALPTGITAATDYWVIRGGADIFQIAASLPDALGSRGLPSVNAFTTDGSGTTVVVAVRGQRNNILTDVDLTGLTTGVTAASLNTAADTVMNAIAVLVTRINRVRAGLGMGAMDVGPGTVATAGTIATIDDSASNNGGDTDSATHATGVPVWQDLLDAERTCLAGLNEIQAAVGQTELALFGKHDGNIESGLDVNQGAAIANAADGATAVSTFLLTEWDVGVDNISDNVALMSDQLDAVTDNEVQSQVLLPFTFNDTAFSAGTNLTVASPVNGHIIGMHGVVTNGTVTTANNVVTVTANGTTVVGLGITAVSAEVVGSTYDDAILEIATGVVKKGDPIVIETDGASTVAGLDGWLIFAEDGSNEDAPEAFRG